MSEMDDPIFTMWAPGEPRGKGRPRARIIKPKGKPQFISLYPDPASAEYEGELAELAAQEWRKPPLDGALTAYIEVFVPIPSSWSNRKRDQAAAGDIPATSKPDGDNYAKIVGDALNKIVWQDDSQIVMWQIFKSYSLTPGIRVSVWLWDTFRPKQETLL